MKGRKPAGAAGSSVLRVLDKENGMVEVHVSKMKPGGPSTKIGIFQFQEVPRTGEFVVIDVEGEDIAVRIGEIVHVAEGPRGPAVTRAVVDY